MERIHQMLKKTQQAPLSFPPRSNLVQRTCPCGGVASIDDLCESCRSQRLSGRGTRSLLEPSWSASHGYDVSGTSHQPIEATQQPSGGFHFWHDFSQIPVHAATSEPIQTKLVVSQPGDKYEQEADQVAEQVMRMSLSETLEGSDVSGSPQTHVQQVSPWTEVVHRQPEQEDEEWNSEPIEEEEETLQAKEAAGHTPTVTPELATRIHALREGGQPLDAATRAFMEPRFGHDFSQVRIHTDERATETAHAVNALAYTVGKDVVFGEGQYAPRTSMGQRLLAHELMHVVQQRNQAQKLQRQPVPGGGATPGIGEGIDLIFIIKAPDDPFTRDITEYIKMVLKAQKTIEVDNLDDIFSYLSKINPRVNIKEPAKGPERSPLEHGERVRRIRIVAHGSTTGGVKMTPKGEQKRRWITPQEVEAYTKRAGIRDIVKVTMIPGAVVEFWGCNIGNVQKAGEAWSTLFQSTFKATTETFKTGFDHYFRKASAKEHGETIPGQHGQWIRVTHTDEVDSRSKGLQIHFRKWLLQRYNELLKNGDVEPINGVDQQITFMRDLFNRSGGDIRHILVEQKTDHKEIRPGDQKNWARLWKTFEPIQVEEKENIWEQTKH